MPPEERAVCARLLKFRKAKGLSRAAFARFVGMDPALLASYELGRSQLNYPAAFQILSRFPLLNPEWLAGGTNLMEAEQNVTYPRPSEVQYGPRSSFIEVFTSELEDRILSSRSAWILEPTAPFPIFRFTQDPAGRLRAEEIFRVWLRRWLAWLPDESLNDYLNELKIKAEALLEQSKRPLHAREDTARRVLEVERLWIEMQAAFLKSQAKHPTQIIDLTYSAIESKSSDVKPKDLWPALKKELQRATAETAGAKTALAGFLEVELSRVSQWLSDSPKTAREPGAEYALLMQAWLKNPKRHWK